MHIDQYNQNQNYILYYIHEKYYNDAIVNISLMSLHLLGLSPTLWGDKLVKDSKGKETMWSRISVFCAAHLWQLIDQIAHLITSCVHKLMSCHVSKEKVLAVWDHALGKRQNGCRLSACFGPSAGLCKGSLESGEQQLSPAPCSKVSNHAESCQHRPKPNTHMQNISDYAVVYVASIWSALTAQYVYIYISPVDASSYIFGMFGIFWKSKEDAQPCWSPCWSPCLWCLLVLLLAHRFNFWSSSPQMVMATHHSLK